MSFNRPDIIRPPSERKSYFLPLTSGCSNNTCTFCGYYGSKLQLRDVDDIKSEIDALALFIREDIQLPNASNVVYAVAQGWDGKRIFLQDYDGSDLPTTISRSTQTDFSRADLKGVTGKFQIGVPIGGQSPPRKLDDALFDDSVMVMSNFQGNWRNGVTMRHNPMAAISKSASGQVISGFWNTTFYGLERISALLSGRQGFQ